MQHLASSSTTNSQNPEFPWQGQPYRRHAQASTSKVKKIMGFNAACVICILEPIWKVGYLLNSKKCSQRFCAPSIPRN